MLNGDDLTDTDAQARAQKWLTNGSISGLPALGLNFRPVDANTGTAPANVLVAQKNGVYYIAVFNYSYTAPETLQGDLGRAGLCGSATYNVSDLWTGATSQATGMLPVSLGMAESAIYKLQ